VIGCEGHEGRIFAGRRCQYIAYAILWMLNLLTNIIVMIPLTTIHCQVGKKERLSDLW